MKVLVLLITLASLASSGIVTHGDGEGGHGRATSYQSIHFEHFHAVPTYIRKEDRHLLEHPLPAGKSSSQVEIHHGGKHDHGYAIVSGHSGESEGQGYEEQGHGGAEYVAVGGQQVGGYEVHDQDNESAQYAAGEQEQAGEYAYASVEEQAKYGAGSPGQYQLDGGESQIAEGHQGYQASGAEQYV